VRHDDDVCRGLDRKPLNDRRNQQFIEIAEYDVYRFEQCICVALGKAPTHLEATPLRREAIEAILDGRHHTDGAMEVNLAIRDSKDNDIVAYDVIRERRSCRDR
jgi:hypothetical protein